MLPTEAGATVYGYAVVIARATAEAHRAVRLQTAGEGGHVSVGASETPGGYMLPQRLSAFKKVYPEVTIALSVGSSEEACARTEDGASDFAVVAGPSLPTNLHTEVLSFEPMVLIAAPDHPLAARASIDPSELQRHEFVSLVGRAALADDRLAGFGIERPRISIVMGNIEGLKHAVSATMGLGVVFRCSVENELKVGDLVELRPHVVSVVRPFYLVYHARKYFSPVQEKLLSYLRQRSE